MEAPAQINGSAAWSRGDRVMASNDDLMSHLGRAVAAAKADRVRVVEADHATDCPHCGRTTDDRIRKCPGCRALLASGSGEQP